MSNHKIFDLAGFAFISMVQQENITLLHTSSQKMRTFRAGFCCQFILKTDKLLQGAITKLTFTVRAKP